MAGLSQTSAARNVPVPDGGLVLPAESEFTAPTFQTVGAEKPSVVSGLDYSAWACAIIDLDGRPSRVATQRQRLATKGYRKAGGNPIVSGYPNPEVWVIPRRQYEANLAKRAERIKQAVDSGQMTEFALPRETVNRG